MSGDHKTSSPRRATIWPRYRIQSAFILLTLLAILFALVGRELSRQRQTIRAIKKATELGAFINVRRTEPQGVLNGWLHVVLGDQYFVDAYSMRLGSSFPAHEVDLVFEFPKLITLSASERCVSSLLMSRIGELTELSELTLKGRGVTDALLSSLDGLSQLTSLVIVDGDVTESALVRLHQMNPQLKISADRYLLPSAEQIVDVRSLHFEGPFTSDSTMAVMGEAKNLRELSLVDTTVGDDGLEHLANLPELRFLRLNNARVTDRGMSRVATCSQLVSLSIPGCEISDDGLSMLSTLTSLTGLDVSNTEITEAGLHHLLSFPKLSSLILDDTSLETERGLRQVLSLPHLRQLHLYLYSTKITADVLSAAAKDNSFEALNYRQPATIYWHGYNVTTKTEMWRLTRMSK